MQYLYQQAQAAWPLLTMEGLKHELGQIQRIDLLYPPLGAKGPPRVATITSKQTLTQAALVSELGLEKLLKTDGR